MGETAVVLRAFDCRRNRSYDLPAMQHALVIGAGFGGMAAAARLCAMGYDVTLLDKLDQLGGRATVYRRNGYVFDAGPTVVTAHFLIDELFALFGKDRKDYINLVPVFPWYRIRFADGSIFNYGGTLDQTLDEIRRVEPADVDGYLKLLAQAKRIFEVGFVQLGDQPFDSLASMLKVAPKMISLGAWRSVWQLTGRYIRNENLRKVFSFQPLLVGGNPFTTTSIYSLIQYLEREWGVHFAMGGTGAIVAGVGRLLREQGVSIKLESHVREIVVNNGAATGVILQNGTRLAADLVVCNADAPHVYRHLIAPIHRRKWTDERIESLDYSMGLFVLYFGTTKTYPEAAHHTILLGHRYRELLHEMFDEKKLEMQDFSLYLHRPTATDPSMAPHGCDSFYVLCPVPNLQGKTNWQEIAPRYRDLIVSHLENTILPGLTQHITEDFYVTPEHFRDTLNTLYGTGFSIQPTFQQSAYFRFHNRSEDIKNLYFVGAATHPGAGMPGVLSSAKVLENLLLKEDRITSEMREDTEKRN